MRIGIGIDTGGTCTDAVIYQFEDRQVLASAKTNTTKEDLSMGIKEALRALPRQLVDQAQVIALSTTLATNACVENKGGRGKLILFGVNPDNVRRSGAQYGLHLDDTLLFVDSKTRPNGQIVREPDWDGFEAMAQEQLADCDAAGIVEMFAAKSGGRLEKRAREIISAHFDIPVVCGHELFAENNIIKRGASVLLNARLLSIIDQFIAAVKRALAELSIDAPFVIVRSDGTLMSEAFARKHPIETLLCGPVASVMGAAALEQEKNALVVDIGGTTTDVALIRDGQPVLADGGVRVGSFDTFVKGLFVDTFGLGGDSGVRVDEEKRVILEGERVMPVSMAAAAYPALKTILAEQAASRSTVLSPREDIYVGIRRIDGKNSYTEDEQRLAALLYRCPLSLEAAGRQLGMPLHGRQLERLAREGIVIRCGMTPTDAMHVLGDFDRFDREAAVLAARRLATVQGTEPETVCRAVYEAVEKKLYCSLVRILMTTEMTELGASLEPQTEQLIQACYAQSKGGETEGESGGFLRASFQIPQAVIIGVGAPTHVFLPEAGRLLSARVVTPAYAEVANALGAIVGNVSAKVVIEVRLNQEDGSYTVYGRGYRYIETNLEQAKALAGKLAREAASEEALERGAASVSDIQVEEEDLTIQTDFGPYFMGYRVTAVASGEIRV